MSDWQTLFTVYGTCFAVWAVVLLLTWDKSSDRYKRCLTNIDLLERELFPEWFEDEEYLLELRPGTMWQVDDPNCVQAYKHHLYGFLTEPRTESPCP